MIRNKCTTMPLTQFTEEKANTHIEKMNGEGWELMSVALESIGIDEKFIFFWRKAPPDVPKT